MACDPVSCGCGGHLNSLIPLRDIFVASQHLDICLIKQVDLVPGELFVAGRVAAGQGQGQVELFLEGEQLGVEVDILLFNGVLIGLQAFSKSGLLSDQCLEDINVVRQLIGRVWHALHYTGQAR